MPARPADEKHSDVAAATRLTPDQLYRACDPASLGFATTDELTDAPITLGQDRAVSAIQFGIGIRHHGYNLFALGPSGAGKHTVVRQFLEQQAADEPTPLDWCYVFNFEQPHRPRAIALPTGRGTEFRDDMARLVDDLRSAVRAALETDEYRKRHAQIDEEFQQRRQAAFADLAQRAAGRDLALIQTPVGLAIVPVRRGKPLDPEAFSRLPDDEREETAAAIREFEGELAALLHCVPQWQREAREKERALKRDVTHAAVSILIDDLASKYADQPAVQQYLASVKADVVGHADDFRRAAGDEEQGPIPALFGRIDSVVDPLSRYQVNVLDGHDGVAGAPVVYEDRPTFQNLIGRIEHIAQMGTLVTHFTLIKPGALHRANGGYLILDARRLLMEPFAWEGLKRALRARAIRVEALSESLSLVSTVSLDPEPIPLQVKSVIQLGGFAFARPSRVTARVRLGARGVVDIEREVELGGPIHSKGVLILSGYLAGHYVPEQPLSLTATLVFEQSYGLVEGDSASSAELFALLSALADLPIAQSFAVTGSVNQRGEIQAIGGVNEKIEGFFDVCRARGLTGMQGVIIPATNVRDLMLRADVVEAVREGQFHIHAIETVDQGIELLTGRPAGVRDETGQFPEGTVNRLVEQRLIALAEQARAFRTTDSRTAAPGSGDGR